MRFVRGYCFQGFLSESLPAGPGSTAPALSEIRISLSLRDQLQGMQSRVEMTRMGWMGLES